MRDPAANTTPAPGKEGGRRRTSGIQPTHSDAGSWWAQKLSRRMSCGFDGAWVTPQPQHVSRPELINYDKKRRFRQCGKKGRVASWVRLGIGSGFNGSRGLAKTRAQPRTAVAMRANSRYEQVCGLRPRVPCLALRAYSLVVSRASEAKAGGLPKHLHLVMSQ
jgi:hypothetical protein